MVILLSRGLKKIVFGFLILFFYFYFFHLKYSWQYKSHETIITQHGAKTAWDYVADINHLYSSNPFVKKIEIQWDRSEKHNWFYMAKIIYQSAKIGKVVGHGEYKILDNGEYIIESQHQICMWFFMCVNSYSTLKFEKSEDGVLLSEEMTLKMPQMVRLFSGVEVFRELLIHRLDKIKLNFEQNI